jgi:tetratricopeptide (TPR) repeat protein
MKRAFVTVVMVMVTVPLLMVSCGDKKVDQQAEDWGRVLELDSMLDDRTGNIPGLKVAEEAMAAFRSYGNNYPEDTLAIPFHLKAAHLAFTLGNYQMSADIFNEVVSIHPEAEEMPYIYIRLGTLYNDHLNDTVLARTFYTKVLDDFPDDPYVESALFGLETLGMNPDEQFVIIRRKAGQLSEE